MAFGGRQFVAWIEIAQGVGDHPGMLLPTGIADNNVETAQFLCSIFNQLRAEGLLAEIAGQGDGFADLLLSDDGNLFRSGYSFGR